MNDIMKIATELLEIAKTYKDMSHITLLDIEKILVLDPYIHELLVNGSHTTYDEGYEDGYEAARAKAMDIVDEVRWM